MLAHSFFGQTRDYISISGEEGTDDVIFFTIIEMRWCGPKIHLELFNYVELN